MTIPKYTAQEIVEKLDAMEQVDDVLVVNWIKVENNNYKKALNDLMAWAIQLEHEFEKIRKREKEQCPDQDEKDIQSDLERTVNGGS